jgi:hypothetical protein
MKLGEVLENARTVVSRRLDREVRPVVAVYDDELWDILAAYGLLKKLDDGELTCYLSGTKLTRENIGGLVGSPEGPRPICDSIEEPFEKVG